MITRGQPFRVLLVDDDHMCRSVTVHLLEACGYEVVAVADGRAAVAAAVREPFALVLMVTACVSLYLLFRRRGWL